MIAVCEDTKSEQDKLLAMLAQTDISNHCTLFQSAEELLEVYRPGQFDLLLMDIYMEGMTGVEAVKQIRQLDRDVSVAFLTTSEDFALEGFRLSALNYLVKPYEKEQLDQVLRQAQAAKKAVPHLTVRRNGQDEVLRLSRICYLESQGRLVMIHLQDGSVVEVYEKLSDLMARLPQRAFFQSHKSYCVNLAQVGGINKELSCFTMSKGENIPIRRLLLSQAKQALQAFLLDQAKLGGCL